MLRRSVLKLIVLGAFGGSAVALAGPKRALRRIRRRVRRRIRRRIRRRVLWRVAGPRRLLVVPLALAVGWELAVDKRVVVVHEVRVDTIVVIDPTTRVKEEIAIAREDDAENVKELPGSPLAANDTAIPSRENEEEVEEEVDE